LLSNESRSVSRRFSLLPVEAFCQLFFFAPCQSFDGPFLFFLSTFLPLGPPGLAPPPCPRTVVSPCGAHSGRFADSPFYFLISLAIFYRLRGPAFKFCAFRSYLRIAQFSPEYEFDSRVQFRVHPFVGKSSLPPPPPKDQEPALIRPGRYLFSVIFICMSLCPHPDSNCP